jgi:hypothetical protein
VLGFVTPRETLAGGRVFQSLPGALLSPNVDRVYLLAWIAHDFRFRQPPTIAAVKQDRVLLGLANSELLVPG